MISHLAWVPKGVSKPVPLVADPPTQEEIEEANKSSGFEESDSEEDDEEMEFEVAAQKADEVGHALAAAEALGRLPQSTGFGTMDIADGLRELDMDNYDDEDEGIDLFGKGVGDLYYPSNEMDPYLKDKEEDESDEDDMAIKDTDSVIVVARNEDDVSHLEVWVYEDSNGADLNMYVHHDIIIPAFPLCTAWLDCPLKGGEKGNFIAVGSMEPSIEIWDLDIIDEVQPYVILGGIDETQKIKKGKKVSVKYKEDSHKDSVLGLAWNKEYRNLLASASADKLVKIWDVSTTKCIGTMDHHTDKVQSIAWNPHVPKVLLSGSFDQTVVMKDGRQPSHPGLKWSVQSDVECLLWDPHNEHSFVVSLEDGTIKGFDIRTANADSSESKPSFTLHAHDKSVCTVSYNPSAPNLLATGSTDRMVKLWDLSNNQPSCIASKNPKVGGVFCVSFSDDNPFLLAIGGSKGNLDVWDTLSESGVSRKFGKYNKRNIPKSPSES